MAVICSTENELNAITWLDKKATIEWLSIKQAESECPKHSTCKYFATFSKINQFLNNMRSTRLQLRS